jgi:DMSO/TMAO reductase YedYZ molybdopterin-dependent catalytic subunit
VWKGTPLGAVLDANVVARPFKELRIQAWDGYVGRVGFDVATKPDTMLAYRMDGKPIPREDGPVRLVVPSQDGFYWIRMITRIEVLR